MRSIAWLAHALMVLGLAGWLATTTLADDPSSTSKSVAPVKDPPGTGPIMNQLRALFAAWDLDGDDYPDKEEQAKAFRGEDAKPYDYVASSSGKKEPNKEKTPRKDDEATSTGPSTTKKTIPGVDYSRYPDYLFLVQLDQDGDGRISRAEFESWGRDCAVQLNRQIDAQTQLLKLQQKLSQPQSLKPAEKKKLEVQLKSKVMPFRNSKGR